MNDKVALAIVFLTESGGRKTMKFRDAKENPDPLKVRDLAEFIVEHNPFSTTDNLIAVEKAYIEFVATTDIEL